MAEPVINYPELIDHAMRGVVREVLKTVQKTGLQGEHYFYLTFRTDHPKARLSPALKARYPQEMTIVMQHQFWDFKVDDQMVSMTLSFGGVPERLEIPFASMVAFADPSVKFTLQFQQFNDANDNINASLSYENEVIIPDSQDTGVDGAEIISLDAFRKK